MFDVLFLGTCACDFSPRLLTDKRDCFDFDVRRSSSMLIDGRYLVDCGPHTLDSMRIAKIALSDVSDVFLTHTHDDHFDPESVEMLAANRKEPLRLWVREDAEIPDLCGVSLIRMEIAKEYEVGELHITSLAANHTASPQHFAFEKGGKRIFYGTDGAWVLYDTFRWMWQKKFDLMVLDGTVGDYNGDFRIGEHNSIPMLRLMIPSFRETGVIGENSLVYLTHLAPSLHRPHAETVRICQKFGADVAFDGLHLKI